MQHLCNKSQCIVRAAGFAGNSICFAGE